MLFRLAVAGVLRFSGVVSREIDEDSFVEEAEEEVEEQVEDADEDAALDGDEVEEEEDDEQVDDEDADGEEEDDEEEEDSFVEEAEDEEVEEQVEDADEDAALDGDEVEEEEEDDEQVDDEDADDEEDEDDEEEEQIDDANEVAEEGGGEEPEQEEKAEEGNGDDPSSLEESNEDEMEEGTPRVKRDKNYKIASGTCDAKGSKLVPGRADGVQWRCKGLFCIPVKARCNGFSNCQDKSDEEGCAMSNVCNASGKKIAIGKDDGKQFRCSGTYCIPLADKCNGFQNCHDGSDEVNCPSPYTAPR